MKIRELLEFKGKVEDYQTKYSYYGHTALQRIIQGYLEKDCIVAYQKERLGVIFIIKRERSFVAFVSLKTGAPYFGGYEYKLAKIGFVEAFELMGEDFVIVNEELMDKLKKRILVEGLKNVK